MLRSAFRKEPAGRSAAKTGSATPTTGRATCTRRGATRSWRGTVERRRSSIARNPDWTTRENELIYRYYPEHGPKWEEWKRLLPLRTYRSIQVHANKLGVRCRYRGPRSWRKSEDRAAVALLIGVCRTTGRSPEAVIRRLDHLVRQMRKKKRKER